MLSKNERKMKDIAVLVVVACSYISSWVEPIFWQSDAQTLEELIENNKHNYPTEYIDVLKQHPSCFEKYEREHDNETAE